MAGFSNCEALVMSHANHGGGTDGFHHAHGDLAPAKTFSCTRGKHSPAILQGFLYLNGFRRYTYTVFMQLVQALAWYLATSVMIED